MNIDNLGLHINGNNNHNVLEPPDNELLDLDMCRRSPNRGAGASRPKRSYTSPQGEIYFKFDMMHNEICAELFSYNLAKQLDICVAVTRLAKSGNALGIASYDIGGYGEPEDEASYSVKDYIGIAGFVNMCLFDYLIMNEDRHAGNWGIVCNKVAPLFDHNYCFGGPETIVDIDNFMRTVTTPFYVCDEKKQRHDVMLLYFVKYHACDVEIFMKKLNGIGKVCNELWKKYFPGECETLNKILDARIQYMVAKVGEFNSRQIDDNEL